MSTFIETQPACKIMRMKQVVAYTGLSRSTLFDLMNPNSKRYDETFPKRIPLTANTVGWLTSELDVWIESRIAQRY